MIVVWAIGGDVVIIYYAKSKCGLNIVQYIKRVLLPLISIALVMILLGSLPSLFMEEGILRLVATCVASTIGMVVSSVLFGLSLEEKSMAGSIVKSIVKRIKIISDSKIE